MNRSATLCTMLMIFAIAPAASAGTSDERPAPPAPAETPVLEISCTATLASRYLFLGVDQNEGHAVFQPEVDLTAGAWSASVWANHDLDRGMGDEFDFVAGYSRSAGAFSASGSFAYLSYPHRYGCNPTQELILGLSYDAALTPELEIHYDIDEGSGVYAIFSAMHATKTPVGALSAGGRVYYENGYYGGFGFPAVEIVAGGEWAAGSVVLSPSISRVASWENGSFSGESRSPGLWLFRLDVSREF